MKNPDFYREVKKWDSELLFMSVKNLILSAHHHEYHYDRSV